MKKETTEKIYCLGKINPNHISISDFSEYVNDHPLVLAKGPPPLSVREKNISKDEVVLQDSTPPAYFDALPSYCLNTQNNQTH